MQSSDVLTVNTNCSNEEIQIQMNAKADLLILGNVITMDEHKPRAEAVAVQGDKIIYVGSADVARKLCDDHTLVEDYGKNSVYPGFLEAHCHPGGAGYKIVGTAHLDRLATLEKNVQIIKEYIDKYPEKELVTGIGFTVNDVMPTAAMLDAICPDKPVICISQDGHSAWLNTPAMVKFEINEAAARKWGTDCIRVDGNGTPTGYLSEGPAVALSSKVEKTVNDMKAALLAWQEYALSNGYTASYNAGVELVSSNEPLAYYELEKEGKLKHYSFAGSLVKDNTDTPEEDVANIAKVAKEHNSKHYKLLGPKAFCDGVIETHTGWMIDEYLDAPGYHGVRRFDDHDKMVRLVKASSEHGFSVHVHALADAAVRAWVDAMAEAEEATGNFDMRNTLAHLQQVQPDDVKRMADYNITACCGMMWRAKAPEYFSVEYKFIGEKAYHSYPLQDYVKCGAVVVSHSDYPVSPDFSVPYAVCLGVIGYQPSLGKETIRNADQNMSREDTLKALTTNVAYSWHEEDRMGSLEIGKLANFAVFDKDFLKDSFEEIEKAKCLATFVDGEQVYKA